MTIALAVITAIAALAALRFPEQYMEPGAARLASQVAAVLLALYLGSRVASFGPPVPGPMSFMQVVLLAIVVLGLIMRVALRPKKK